jgi:hypothetical protein
VIGLFWRNGERLEDFEALAGHKFFLGVWFAALAVFARTAVVAVKGIYVL